MTDLKNTDAPVEFPFKGLLNKELIKGIENLRNGKT